MTPCFADAYFFLAMLNPRDEAHGAAVTVNREALTADHHFEQAGFIALLKPGS